MKYLILGDVHGNLPALEKVLDLYSKEVDVVVSHGDVVNYGPWSNECVEILNDLGAVCLKGNHEDAFINGDYTGSNTLVKTFFKETYKGFKHLDIISNYKNELILKNWKISHTINNTYYYPDSDLSQLSFDKNSIIGHSHYAFNRKIPNGKYLVNTGSIGQNRKDISLINFVILNNNSVEMKEITYDVTPLISKFRQLNFPEECISYYINKL